jgi:hypothetical protein
MPHPWTRQDALAYLAAYAERHGMPKNATAWREAPGHPSYIVLQRLFGRDQTWQRFLAAYEDGRVDVDPDPMSPYTRLSRDLFTTALARLECACPRCDRRR